MKRADDGDDVLSIQAKNFLKAMVKQFLWKFLMFLMIFQFMRTSNYIYAILKVNVLPIMDRIGFSIYKGR